MPRIARASEGGLCYHVLNRGNARAGVFHDPADYEAFLDAVAGSNVRLPVRVLAYCSVEEMDSQPTDRTEVRGYWLRPSEPCTEVRLLRLHPRNR
jgi:hypothetical protein